MNRFSKDLLKELLQQRKRLDAAILGLRKLTRAASNTRKAKQRLRKKSAGGRRKTSRSRKARSAGKKTVS